MEQPTIDPDAFNAFEAAGWERRAAGYDRVVGRITGQLVDPLLDAAYVRAGSRVLDLATGPGYVAARAAERGASAVGVDVAEAMISLARRLHPGLDFRQADAHHLPFDDDTFDAVVGNFLILHLGRPEQAVAGFVRVLRPGGRLAPSRSSRICMPRRASNSSSTENRKKSGPLGISASGVAPASAMASRKTPRMRARSGLPSLIAWRAPTSSGTA